MSRLVKLLCPCPAAGGYWGRPLCQGPRDQTEEGQPLQSTHRLRGLKAALDPIPRVSWAGKDFSYLTEPSTVLTAALAISAILRLVRHPPINR